MEDVQADAEAISRLIKGRITPFPNFILTPERENGKDLLVLTVYGGRSTPYYYKADGVMEAYIRMGNESVISPDYVLNQLLLKGMNRTYDALSSEYDFKDYAFSKLRERYKVWTGNSWEDKLFDSFEIRDTSGKLTNAGALLADDSPIRHSRLFCTRWKKTPDSRIEMPEYCERSVFEALVNGLIHRDYLILGSEVHIDMYDDRLTITSPGGMADGTRIQERDIDSISSTRRNPVLADIFGRLGYMERQGSGFKKITEAYYAAHNYRAELEPKFYSDVVSFQVTLYNLNYGKPLISSENQLFQEEKAVVSSENQSFEALLLSLKAKRATKDTIIALYRQFGFDTAFARADVMRLSGITSSPAGALLDKLKTANLIEPVRGQGKGKYRFMQPKE